MSNTTTVGVRELEQHLSEYLERAERGETIHVTDRGRAKAVRGPLPGRGRLDQGIAEGWVTPAPRPSALGPVRRAKATEGVLDALAEDHSG